MYTYIDNNIHINVKFAILKTQHMLRRPSYKIEKGEDIYTYIYIYIYVDTNM
jgi:hypothetical protein